jgi:23S rRNA (uracil1939-C5)-methyltransferase
LRAFADCHHVQFWLQKGTGSAVPFYPLNAAPLSYHLPEFDVVMPFHPTEFTQVNPHTNQLLVKRAIDLLDPQPHERIVDAFCGLGNFTLALARRGAYAIGLEGNQVLVNHAMANAALNHLAHRTEFTVRNLFKITPTQLHALGRVDKMLIDPPRDGALTLIKALDKSGPQRIVYISCNPATLARDSQILVAQGYTLKAAGIINMFAQTNHIESIALFEKTAL